MNTLVVGSWAQTSPPQLKCAHSQTTVSSTWLRFIFLDYNSNLLFKIDAGLLNPVQLNRYKISQLLGNSFKCFKVLAQPQKWLGSWTCNLVGLLGVQVLHPAINWIFFSVPSSSTPQLCYVNRQLVCLLPLRIFQARYVNAIG